MTPAAIIEGHLLTRCEICGQPASHGQDVHIRWAIDAKDAGKIEQAKVLLGRWYCNTCKKEKAE